MPDCCASDLVSIPSQVFLKIFFLLNSSILTRIMEKLEYHSRFTYFASDSFDLMN